MMDTNNEKLTELAERMIIALERLSTGGTFGPTGFEELSMAITGDGPYLSLSEAVEKVADAIESVADALSSIAAIADAFRAGNREPGQ